MAASIPKLETALELLLDAFPNHRDRFEDIEERMLFHPPEIVDRFRRPPPRISPWGLRVKGRKNVDMNMVLQD